MGSKRKRHIFPGQFVIQKEGYPRNPDYADFLADAAEAMYLRLPGVSSDIDEQEILYTFDDCVRFFSDYCETHAPENFPRNFGRIRIQQHHVPFEIESKRNYSLTLETLRSGQKQVDRFAEVKDQAVDTRILLVYEQEIVETGEVFNKTYYTGDSTHGYYCNHLKPAQGLMEQVFSDFMQGDSPQQQQLLGFLYHGASAMIPFDRGSASFAMVLMAALAKRNGLGYCFYQEGTDPNLHALVKPAVIMSDAAKNTLVENYPDQRMLPLRYYKENLDRLIKNSFIRRMGSFFTFVENPQDAESKSEAIMNQWQRDSSVDSITWDITTKSQNRGHTR